jgi:polyhydroxyalkanoate synthesis regulator phasin|tara:strand:+ start:251 stop:508 length:258 start_codon:yes stop_codon:yes gene_type:complete
MISIEDMKSMMDIVVEAVRTLEENDKKLSDLLVKQSKMQVALAKSVCILAGEIDKINKNEEGLLSKITELNSMMINVGEWKEENI